MPTIKSYAVCQERISLIPLAIKKCWQFIQYNTDNGQCFCSSSNNDILFCMLNVHHWSNIIDINNKIWWGWDRITEGGKISIKNLCKLICYFEILLSFFYDSKSLLIDINSVLPIYLLFYYFRQSSKFTWF